MRVSKTFQFVQRISFMNSRIKKNMKTNILPSINMKIGCKENLLSIRSVATFCDQKNKDNNNKSQKQQSLNQKKQNQQKVKQQMPIEKDEQQFNAFIGLPKDHSFKKDLIVAQQRYKKQIKQLKQAILFEDLLKKQIDILIYDTQGKPFKSNLVRSFLTIVAVVGFLVSVYKAAQTDDKFKLIMQKTTQGRIVMAIPTLICVFLIWRVFMRHMRMSKRFVQKIVYHTQNEKFTLTKRRPWGSRYDQQVSRFKILYTENQFLNKRGTNYLNIQNQNQYQIGYMFAWKKQDLFSHLISQRIRT